MATARTMITCPACGAPMNHHADKLVESTGHGDAPDIDSDLGGVVQEAHSCPRCGRSEFRRARPTPA